MRAAGTPYAVQRKKRDRSVTGKKRQLRGSIPVSPRGRKEEAPGGDRAGLVPSMRCRAGYRGRRKASKPPAALA
jgi:hypothetical protein